MVPCSSIYMFIVYLMQKWLWDSSILTFSGFWWLFPDVAVCYKTKSIFQIFNSGVFLVRSTGPSYSCRKFRLKCSVIKQIWNIDDHKNKQLFIKMWFPFWDVQINGIIYIHLPKPQKMMKNINHVQSYN